jgi:hypothetical protein
VNSPLDAFLYLQERMQHNLNQMFDDQATIRLALFIVFDVGTFLLHFFVWLPLA